MNSVHINLSVSFIFANMLFVVPANGQTALDRARPQGVEAPREPAAATPPSHRLSVDVEPVPARTETTHAVLVGAIVIRGLQDLAPGDFADILAMRIGQTLSTADLSALADAIAGRARSRGLVFASAWIGAQQLENGVLTVDIDEGRVDEIRFDGAERPAVRAALEPLADGKPVRLSQLERRLLIAGDVDGMRIQNSRYLREGDRGVLLVKLAADRIAAQAIFANEGTKPLGPEQLTLQVDFSGLLASDDSLTLTWSETPFEPEELQFGRVRYEKRISRSGTELAVAASASRARPGAYLDPFRIRSESWYVGGTILQPLWRRRAASLWLEGELSLRQLLQWRAGVRARNDRVAALRGTLYGYADLARGRLRVSTTISQGLGILGATGVGDPLASRQDADGTFTAISAWVDWTRNLGGDFSLRIAVQSQLSSRPLLVSEEIGLGGTGFLRGYDWAERSGDEGAMGMAELRYLWDHPFRLIRRAQLYAFIDGGKATNRDNGFGSGGLASAGGGVRADISRTLGANIELAVPLTGPRYDTGDDTPKLNFRLLQSF